MKQGLIKPSWTYSGAIRGHDSTGTHFIPDLSLQFLPRSSRLIFVSHFFYSINGFKLEPPREEELGQHLTFIVNYQ